MDTTILTICIVLSIFSITTLIVIVWMIKTEKRLKRFFQGQKACDLEESFHILNKKINALEMAKNEHTAILDNHHGRLQHMVKSVPLTRFNPFPEAGGNQSFAMSFVDEKGNGVILSSLYARDRMSMFAKGVQSGKGQQELSIEEQNILEKSLQ